MLVVFLIHINNEYKMDGLWLVGQSTKMTLLYMKSSRKQTENLVCLCKELEI